MPRSKDPLLRLLAKHHRLDEWERYTGPQGGEGWINTVTGEKVYQEDKPGSGSGEETKSATYNKARGIFEDNVEEVIGGEQVAYSAVKEALWQTNADDTANALVDFYEDKYADSEDDPTATALAKVKHTASSISEDLLKEVEATSTLDTGEEVTWHMVWGDSINVDQRVETAQQVLDSKGFSERDQDDYRKMMAGQKRGPKTAGSGRMQAFNKVAVEDAGASGHRGVYRPFGAEVDTLRAVREPLLKTLRRMYGDTITVYRGEENFSDIGEYKEVNGNEVIDFDSHQPAESWSLRPLIARNFGGHILKAEVPIDRVISTTMSGAGYDKEAEVLVAMDRQQRWEYGDNLFTYDADDVPKSRSGAEREEYYDDDRLSPRDVFAAELRFAKHHMMLTQPGIELAEWERYTGPQGGEGWINTVTGEKVYQEEKPGSGNGESAESEGYEKARAIIGETATEDESGFGVKIDAEATLKALAQATPEDTVKALYDTVADIRGTAPIPDGVITEREKRVRHKIVARHTNRVWANTTNDITVNVTLDTGDVVEFSPYGTLGLFRDNSGRGQAMKTILRAEGYKDSDIRRLFTKIESHQRGHSPDKQSLSVFNAVAREVGAEGQEPALDPPDEVLVNMLQDLRKPMLKALRAMYGDTITVYRGENNRKWPKDTETVTDDDGNTYSQYDRHKPAESWSVRPQMAQTFGSIVLKREVPVEEVVLANITGAGYDGEMEMLCAMDHTETWEHGEEMFQFYYDKPGRAVGEVAPRIGPKELHRAEYRALKHELELSQSNIQLAQWVKYSGPRGGEGWQNTETGEVTYGEKPGDVDESQEQQTLPGAKIDTSERYTEGEVWNGHIAIKEIIRSVTGNEDLTSLDDFYTWVEQHGTEADIREVHSRLASGPTPYDVTDDDVPDPKYNVNNYQEFGNLRQMLQGEMHGISADNMYVAENNRGDKLYISNLRKEIKHVAKFHVEEAHNAATASKLMGVMGEDTPYHHLVEGEYLAVEESHGVDLKTHLEMYHDSGDDQRDTIDNYASHIAANVVLGNSDTHQRNVFYKYGRYETIDMDMALSAKHPQNVMEIAARKFETHLNYLYGYRSTQEAQAERAEAAYLLSEELEYRAGQMQAWLTEGEEAEGISPDDLTDDQRDAVESMIGYINSGEHWQLIRDIVV